MCGSWVRLHTSLFCCAKTSKCPTWLRIWYQVSHLSPGILISSHSDCPTLVKKRVAGKINFQPDLTNRLAFCSRLQGCLRVRPANFQRMPVVRWKLHASDLRENRTIGSPRLVFHENGPYLIIWAFKNPKNDQKIQNSEFFKKLSRAISQP